MHHVTKHIVRTNQIKEKLRSLVPPDFLLLAKKGPSSCFNEVTAYIILIASLDFIILKSEEHCHALLVDLFMVFIF